LDDPSANSPPVDPTGNAGNDSNETPQAGTFNAIEPCMSDQNGISCLTDASGVATIEFTTTMQPGDNFAVAASTRPMKYKFLTIATICFSLIYLLLQIACTQSARSQTKLELTITASKPSYMVGELNSFNFEISNKSNENVSFANALGTGTGYLKVFISKGDNNFKRYVGPRWGQDDAGYGVLTLKPNESVKNTVTIFWNGKPVISNSSPPDVIKRATEGKILTDYAFPEAETYYVKASYSIFFTKQANPVLIESEPIKVIIEKPIGEDLEVWNKIKGNGDFAYFLQEGDFKIPNYKTDEWERFRLKIEQILNQYPNSFYADSLGQSLEKFRTIEAEKKEFLEKIQKEKERPQ